MRAPLSVVVSWNHLANCCRFSLNPLTQGFYPPQSTEPTKPIKTGESTGALLDPFTLKDADEERDEKFKENLDLETAIFRRRYHLLMGLKLRGLKRLDGLVYCKGVLGEKDEIWREMERRGLLLGEGQPDQGRGRAEE